MMHVQFLQKKHRSMVCLPANKKQSEESNEKHIACSTISDANLLQEIACCQSSSPVHKAFDLLTCGHTN